MASPEKVIVVGAGPVGSLAALYAAQRGYQVEVYELRNGTFFIRESRPWAALAQVRFPHAVRCATARPAIASPLAHSLRHVRVT